MTQISLMFPVFVPLWKHPDPWKLFHDEKLTGNINKYSVFHNTTFMLINVCCAFTFILSMFLRKFFIYTYYKFQFCPILYFIFHPVAFIQFYNLINICYNAMYLSHFNHVPKSILTLVRISLYSLQSFIYSKFIFSLFIYFYLIILFFLSNTFKKHQ